MTRITIDEEFGDGGWFDYALATPPIELWPLLDGTVQSIVVSKDTARFLEEWCRKLPGWNDGTSFASHPLLFNPTD